MHDSQPRKFTKLVTVQLLTDTKDSTTGEFNVVGTTLCQRWASIEPLIGRELMVAKGVEADVTHQIEMNNDSVVRTMTPKMRIVYGTRIFNILFVFNVEERNRRTRIWAKEQV